MMTLTPAWIFGEDPSHEPSPVLAERTSRGLMRVSVEEIACPIPFTEQTFQESTKEPAWWIRAGTWPVTSPPFRAPPPSSTKRPLVALGRTIHAPLLDDTAPPSSPSQDSALPKNPYRDAAHREGLSRAAGLDSSAAAHRAWDDLLARTGGDLDSHLAKGGSLPQVDSAYLEVDAAQEMARRMRRGLPFSEALSAAIQATKARVVRIDTLDVMSSPALRLAQVVTSLQQGGAERLAIDLSTWLPRFNVSTKLFALGMPLRKMFDSPPGTVDLSRTPGSRERRLFLLRDMLSGWGADLVHAHLLTLEDMNHLARGGFRPLVTAHNMKPGWPPALESIGPETASLLVGCARAVEDDLRRSGVRAPCRTVWNGIDLDRSRLGPEEARKARESKRQSYGIKPDDVVLLAAANPRPQKRLHLLPGILSSVTERLRSAGDPRDVWVLWAGDNDSFSLAAENAISDLSAQLAKCPEQDRFCFLGSVDPMTPLYAACDALISPSAHEGLSLAHLEALAAGLPVIASGTGGTLEVSRLTSALTFVDSDDPQDFAEAIVRAVTVHDSTGAAAVERHFTTARMVEGYTRLYTRAAVGPTTSHRKGLLLVTNNLSTGGAQSSARRLLAGLHKKGIRVRAAVLEEQPEYPTVGRTDLLQQGISTLTFREDERRDPGLVVRRILEEMTLDPPAAVLFWNAIAAHKVLLAEALFDLPVFDVSPGEMYFTSLSRYFESPRPGVPCLSPRDYGSRLAGAIVKYEAERDLAERTLGAPVHVIANGVPARDPVPVRGSTQVAIGTTVRIHPHKKIEELTEALRLLTGRREGVSLHVAGGPDHGQEAYFESLKQATSDLPITWRGELADVTSFLRTLDIFALVAEPSGCPNSSLEALSFGLPVVATDVGGMRDQIEPEVSGLLVPRADPASFAAALGRVASDKALRERLSRGALERIRERFSIERMISDYERVCLEGVSPGGLSRSR